MADLQVSDPQSLLLEKLTQRQQDAVKSSSRRVLIIAGAGSGKTEVMARRVAWWVAVEGVPKDSIVAFTFTERAAEEMKFRIRQHVNRVTPEGEDATLGGMYIGTIHGFCVKMLRELSPDKYHNYDVIDDAARLALIQRGYHGRLALPALQNAAGKKQFATIDHFLNGYDLLNEYDQLRVKLPKESLPHDVAKEAEWIKAAGLLTNTGGGKEGKAFAVSAARYYAYLRCRRFLDFSTSQSELLRVLRRDKSAVERLRGKITHLVVDELQDTNPVQDAIFREILGGSGFLTAVGDHRQAIFGWRGGRVEIMADLYNELKKSADAEIVDLRENFRSTPLIIGIANRWAETIGSVHSMASPEMKHGRNSRLDTDPTHVAALTFGTREDEASWIGKTIGKLVRPSPKGVGAAHDTREGERGIGYSDIAILLRTSTSARTYMEELERQGIPAVFRAGPDLFSQPEVLLFIGLLGRMAGLSKFMGADWGNSLPSRIQQTLTCQPDPQSVILSACKVLDSLGLNLGAGAGARLLLATNLIQRRIAGESLAGNPDIKKLRTPALMAWLGTKNELRRVFPQTLFHFMLAEAGVSVWELAGRRGTTAMFHLGTLSTLVKGIETPGWTSTSDFKYQIIALYLWGTHNARTEEAPLLVPQDAVTISTIHSAKGLEFPAVFLADVVPKRFPSSKARQVPAVPFSGAILKQINPADLADNLNYDSERRLMYVALTRAERFLFVTSSGKSVSQFFSGVAKEVKTQGGKVGEGSKYQLQGLKYLKSESSPDLRLATSFSDLRYYLECPHDFYLRKVLGFAPSIDQAFGYGRGIHNLLRAIHSNPKRWAELSQNSEKLKKELDRLVRSGLLYLRYTTGDPLKNMQDHARKIIRRYVEDHGEELDKMQFEPEREFETLIPEEQVLVSGAIDLIRLDDPPRVSLIDFKSGDVESDNATKLSEQEMRLQVSMYGLAAKRELEFEPDRGLVRYLDEEDKKKRELAVALDETALQEARATIVKTASAIRDRKFDGGPVAPPRNGKNSVRCAECDFVGFCGLEAAKTYRLKSGKGT